MPTDPTGRVTLSANRRWATVVISLLVTASAFVFINGVAFLIPALEEDLGTPLAEAGLLSSMPSFGMVTTLILWGWLLDRVGERIVMTTGSVLTAAAAYGATTAHSVDGRGGLRGDHRSLRDRFRGMAIRRRYGGRKLQFGGRQAGLRMVPARTTRARDGRPADRAAPWNCIGRVGHSDSR